MTENDYRLAYIDAKLKGWRYVTVTFGFGRLEPFSNSYFTPESDEEIMIYSNSMSVKELSLDEYMETVQPRGLIADDGTS